MKLGSVLKQIIQDKKKLVEESKNNTSLQELKIKTYIIYNFNNSEILFNTLKTINLNRQSYNTCNQGLMNHLLYL